MSDFVVTEGDTKFIDIEISDATADALTGSSLKWGFFNVVKTGELDSTGVTYRVKLDPADTEGKVGKHIHEAEVTDAQGNVTTVLRGTLEITRSNV